MNAACARGVCQHLTVLVHEWTAGGGEVQAKAGRHVARCTNGGDWRVGQQLWLWLGASWLARLARGDDACRQRQVWSDRARQRCSGSVAALCLRICEQGSSSREAVR